MFDASKIKKDFPIFEHHPDLVYLDNASTTQTPRVVIGAMERYYKENRANIHRGVYKLSAEATELYESARKVVADFIYAESNEIIFTSGATHGLNLLAYSLCKGLARRSESGARGNVVLSRMEHHANLIPWQEMAKQYGFEIRWIELKKLETRNQKLGNHFELDLQSLERVLDKNTKIVSVTHVSNTLGTINPIKDLVKAAKKVGATTIVDAAQSIAHMLIDVKNLDCDFLVFSGHKMYGPTGIGVLYGKQERLEKLEPFIFGGDMIKEVTFEQATWHDVPWKFEAGTPNIAGAIGLATAVQYIQKIGFKDIQKHEKELAAYAIQELEKIEGIKIIGPKENRVGVISFVLEGVHPHDVATILDRENVAVRAGHHCTMPLMHHIGIKGTVRASLAVYTSREDIDRLVKCLDKVKKIFK